MIAFNIALPVSYQVISKLVNKIIIRSESINAKYTVCESHTMLLNCSFKTIIFVILDNGSTLPLAVSKEPDKILLVYFLLQIIGVAQVINKRGFLDHTFTREDEKVK